MSLYKLSVGMGGWLWLLTAPSPLRGVLRSYKEVSLAAESSWNLTVGSFEITKLPPFQMSLNGLYLK